MQKLRHTRAFRLRGPVAGFVFFPALLLVSFGGPIAEPGTFGYWLFDSLGFIFLTLYATCRIWATLYVGGRKDEQLQSTGIYSLSRNPLYLGSTCLALSGSFFLQSPLLFALTAIILGYYLFKVIPSEEAVLRDRFGAAFDEYTRLTSRFVPRLTSYRPAAGVTLDFPALRREARRLWGAALLPIVGELIATLRVNPHWPHLFRLL